MRQGSALSCEEWKRRSNSSISRTRRWRTRKERGATEAVQSELTIPQLNEQTHDIFTHQLHQ